MMYMIIYIICMYMMVVISTNNKNLVTPIPNKRDKTILASIEKWPLRLHSMSKRTKDRFLESWKQYLRIH